MIAAIATGAIEAYDLKTRTAGRVTFIESHRVVPGTMTVAASHEICDRLEAALDRSCAEAQVLIHVEPRKRQSGRRAGASTPGARPFQPHLFSLSLT